MVSGSRVGVGMDRVRLRVSFPCVQMYINLPTEITTKRIEAIHKEHDAVSNEKKQSPVNCQTKQSLPRVALLLRVPHFFFSPSRCRCLNWALAL